MFTIVFKERIENYIVFEVFKKPFLGRQRVVGNIFCIKDEEGNYKATSSFYVASWPNYSSIRWDGGRKSYCLEEKAVDICKHILYGEDSYQIYK